MILRRSVYQYRFMLNFHFLIMAPIPKQTWDVVLGPLGEYMMQENCALRQELRRMNAAYSSLYTSRLLSMQNFVEDTERLEGENMALRAEANNLRYWNRLHQMKIVKLAKKRDHGVRLARSVNRDNVTFQKIAKLNGVLLKLRAIPESFFKALEEDSDETDNEEENLTTEEELLV